MIEFSLMIRPFALVLCFMFFGCAHEAIVIQKSYVDPQYGMTKLQLLDLVGKPESIQVYKRTDGSFLEFYMYTKHYQTSQTTIPVCLAGNKVVGWGESYFQDHISTDEVRIK